MVMNTNITRNSILSSPWFWLAVAVVLIVTVGIIVVNRKKYNDSLNVPIPDVDVDFDAKEGIIKVDNSRNPQEILNDIYAVSEHFANAASRVAINWGAANEASEAWMIKLVKALGSNNEVSSLVLDAYASALDRWQGQVDMYTLQIIDAIAENSDIEGDLTVCTQTTNFIESINESERTDINVTVKSGSVLLGLGAAWNDKTQEVTTQSSKTVTYVPTCTAWQVDPALLASKMAAKEMAYKSLYGLLQTVIDNCPKIDNYIKVA